MRKKKVGHDRLVTVRLAPDMIEHLDVEVARLRERNRGAVWTRSGLVRKLLSEGLARMVGA